MEDVCRKNDDYGTLTCFELNKLNSDHIEL